MEYNIYYRQIKFHNCLKNLHNYYENEYRLTNDYSYHKNNINQVKILEKSNSLDKYS